jgi:BirA family biotin operon repressor/biotin-[acetyl-CoA-carboxylase] ligase
MNQWQIIELNSITSTNNYANMLLSKNQSIDKTAIVAWSQTQGRGMGENTWESEDFKNLTASFIISAKWLKAENQFYLSRVVCLAIVDFFKNYGIETLIKWPNDIYACNKKIGGILIENTIVENKIVSSVIGIGLNINQEAFTSNAPGAVSLKKITGNEVDLKEALNFLINFFDVRLEHLKDKKYKEIENEYLRKIYWFEQWHDFEASGKIFKGCIKGTANTGELMVLQPDGNIENFMFKEIKFLQ